MRNKTTEDITAILDKIQLKGNMPLNTGTSFEFSPKKEEPNKDIYLNNQLSQLKSNAQKNFLEKITLNTPIANQQGLRGLKAKTKIKLYNFLANRIGNYVHTKDFIQGTYNLLQDKQPMLYDFDSIEANYSKNN